MSVMLTLGAVAVIGFLCQWLAWRAKLPAILFLLLMGILAGPVTGLLNPDALFGDLLFPAVSLAVAVILFEGSLTLKRKELEGIGPVVWKMVSVGALVNALIVTVACHYLVGLAWPLASLFGAMMVVTGPTVIVPLLRAVRPNTSLSRTLRWEGVIIDPLGALFAVLVFEWIVVQQTNAELTQIIWVFLKTVASGSIIGAGMALPFGLLLRHHLIPEYLHNFAGISFVVAAFVLSESLTHESGLLAVTVMGIWLANMKGVHTRGILEFKESLTIILVSGLFILLAARIDFSNLAILGWGGLGVLLVMQFIARPVKVWLSTLGSPFSWQEKSLLAWLGPRGIVAAAVSALFALRLEQLNYAQAELLVPLAFSVIIGTVVIQSLTARPLALWLGVSQPNTTGHLIIGANPVARVVGKALSDAGSKVVLCDNYWENIKEARMLGLPTYYGNPISEHAELHIELSELGGMVGLSFHDESNVAAALRYREDFGVRQVFTLASSEGGSEHVKRKAGEMHKGRILFDEDITYAKLASMISRGGQVRKTILSDKFSFDDWRSKYSKSTAIPLFALDPNEKIIWFNNQDVINPRAGWTIVSLLEDNAGE